MDKNWEYCPLCNQKIEKFTSKEHCFNAAQDIAKTYEETFNLTDIDILKKQVEASVKGSEDALFALQQKSNFALGLKESITKDIGANNFAISSLRRDVVQTKDRLNKIGEINLNDYEEELSIKRSLLNNLEEKLKTLKQIPVPKLSVSEISEKINSLQLRIQNYKSIEKANHEIELRNQEKLLKIEQLNKEIKELEEKQVKTIKQKNIHEEAFKVFDKNLPNIMTINACSTLQNNINNFIQKTFSNYEVVLQASKKGCEFFYTKNSSVVEGKKKNNYLLNSKMSSGFEKDILTLSFKVSLAELYDCNCMVLDEADGASDEDNAMLLYDTLMNRFDQIILTTHKNSIKEYLQNNYNAKFITFNNGEIQD